MKTITTSPILKLLAALVAIALLTSGIYFAAMGAAFTMLSTEKVAALVLEGAMSNDMDAATDYVYLQANSYHVDEKDRSQQTEQAIAAYQARFDPTATNFRYRVTVGDQVVGGNYAGEDCLCDSRRYFEIFAGTPEQEQQLIAYQENDVYMSQAEYEELKTSVADYEAYLADKNYMTQEEYLQALEMLTIGELSDKEYKALEKKVEAYEAMDYHMSADEYEVQKDRLTAFENSEAPLTYEAYAELRGACYQSVWVQGMVLMERTVEDNYSRVYDVVVTYAQNQEATLSRGVLLGIAGLVLLLVLLVAAGQRNAEGVYEAAYLGRMPWDAWLVLQCGLLGLVAVTGFLPAELFVESLRFGDGLVNFGPQQIQLVLQLFAAFLTLCVAWGVQFLYSAVARLKVRGWWRNCLCGKVLMFCLRWCKKLWLWVWGGCKKLVRGSSDLLRNIPLIWKAVAVIGVLWLVETIYLASAIHSGDTALLAIFWNTIKYILCAAVCLMMKRLQEGARTIADGDLDYRIDTQRMIGDFKTHAECLNRIGDGLSRSVDSQLRAERMKTELITNVSHDLKTPLTSIVNYVDLLKKEPLEGNAEEYVEVLDRQSARLKKLTEDLVEASKASTGSLSVTVERVRLTELLEQAQAEYNKRLSDAGLQTIVRRPDEEVEVWADGKYVWRILDNLLSNVCKYAMPNTRVYLELQTDGDNAILRVKNISRESLNISAQELMERFVRGDSSRTTEGSGLGLSIARSLAELMGGQVQITVDGDLFKADVTLPLAK